MWIRGALLPVLSLFLAAPSLPVNKNKEAETPSFTPALPIDCETNQPNIQLLKQAVMVREASLVDLLKKRSAEKLTEAENTLLLVGELDLGELRLKVSMREYFDFYCRNPDKIPSPEIQPLGMTT